MPKQYVPGTAAPFIVGADGTDQMLFTALDNLIAEHKVPVMIAISIQNGGADAQGSERGLEYDTMSGLYAEFVEKEVLPQVEKHCNVKLTKDPEGRATMGGSSGGSAAMAMAGITPSGITACSPTLALTSTNNGRPTRRRRTVLGNFTSTSFLRVRSSRYGFGWR
ncbi:MAG: alpha/beta hydrolase-fold protein [Ignavibacteriota bacterium]